MARELKGNKHYGTVYESMFAVEALKRSLHLSEPKGDYMPYDFVLDNGRGLHRIQVKGTKSRSQSSGYKITVGQGNSRGGKDVRPNDSYDFLAAVVMHEGDSIWYIIPEKLITTISIKFFCDPRSKGKWEKYKHAWNLIC
jgi:hypothetical protein